MNPTRQHIEFIDHLIEMTQNKSIHWERKVPPSNLNGTEVEVDYIYTTQYEDKFLRVYEETYKNFTDEFEFYWATRPIVEFTTIQFDPLWTFPTLTNSYTLLDTIKYRDAGVDEFMQRVLKRN